MAYTPSAILFDGSTNNLDLGANPTGIVDGKVGLLSFWYRKDAANSNTRILSTQNTDFEARITASGVVQVIGDNAASAAVLNFTAGSAAIGTWQHIVASWNLATTTTQSYADGAAVHTEFVATDDDIDYTDTPWFVGEGGGGKFNGAIADLYFTTEYLDISVEANRRKFISADGFPVYLGADGSTPTGTAPLIFLQGKDLTNRGVNSGSGGDFAENGTFTPTEGPGNFVVPAQILAKRSGRYHRLHR